MTAPKLTPERIAEIRSYTTDKSGNRWWSEFGLGDALVFVEELLDGIESLAAEADRNNRNHRRAVEALTELATNTKLDAWACTYRARQALAKMEAEL